MTARGDQGSEVSRLHLEAHAAGDGTVYQAARDQYIGDLHLYYGDGVHGVRRTEPSSAADTCPYPGMAAFGPAEAAWFFGRDAVTACLLERVDEQSREGGALAVVAPSGAGKSSLLMAGLVPRLANGALPGSRHWPVLAFTPTAHPMRALAGLLASFTGTTFAEVAETMAAGCDSGTAMLREALRTRAAATTAASDIRLLLIVDQLEELFTLGVDETERQEFLDFLSCVTTGGGEGEEPMGVVVYGVRADFYTMCAGYPQLRSVLQDAQVLVGPMASDELRAAVLYPAQEAGIRVENGLVELLLRDLGLPAADSDAGRTSSDEAGRLPLLAHALRTTWQQRHGSTLTVDGYKATGGIHRAVASTAERVYTGLNSPEKEMAPALFLRLVSIGDGIEDTRRRMPRTSLLAGLDASTASAVLDAFTRSRLLTQEQSTVEITHEALLRAWPRLRTWIDSDKAGHVTRQELERTAAVWARDGRDPASLYRGSRLEEARRASGASRALSPPATAFLDASTRQEQLVLRRRHRIIAALCTLSLLATAAAGFAFWQWGIAREQRDVAIGNRLSAEAERLRATDVSVAAQLDLAAHSAHPSPTSRTTLINMAGTPLSIPLSGHKSAVDSVSFHPGGRILASAGYDGTVRLWDVSVPTRPEAVHDIKIDPKGSVYSVAFSPDGKMMATAGDDGTVRLWDVTKPTRPALSGAIPTDGARPTYSVSFHSDGHTLICVSTAKSPLSPPQERDRIVRLWNIIDPTRPTLLGKPLTTPYGLASSAVSSKGGRTLLAKGGRLWDLTEPATPRAVAQIELPEDIADGEMALSPDGNILAVPDTDRSVQLWSLADLKAPTRFAAPLRPHTGAITAMAFNHNGRVLATASSGRTVLLWNLANPSGGPSLLSEPLTGHTEQVSSVAFSPDGRTLATAGGEGKVRLWNIPNSSLLTAHDWVNSVAFSPDGRTLATAGSSVRLWDSTDPSDPTPLGKPLDPPGDGDLSQPWPIALEARAVTFSPDGKILAVAGDDGTELWDVTHPAKVNRIGKTTSRGEFGKSVDFSPDGKTLATAGSGGVMLWDTSNPKRISPRGEPLVGKAKGAVFSPNGRILSTISSDADGDVTVRLWDTTDPDDPTLLSTLPASEQSVDSVAFHPEGNLMASAGFADTVRLWNVEAPKKPTPAGVPLKQHGQRFLSVAFHPDGKILAGAGEGGTIRLWDVTDPKEVRSYGSPLTSPGWTTALEFSPSGDVMATDSDRFAHLLPMNADQAAQRICRATAGIITRNEWLKHVPDVAFARPCK
ncbi:hypothetical protein ACFC08_35040 [Streptomyces sp. NPDC056112]|uniref:WD40 repeat domain-containing protein n=1 Tax=Streptomyces sp. NPDC056112 TaxID=3345715 RepID=UPI0035E0704E